MINIVKKELCYGCGACNNVCPKNCILMEQDEEGFLYPKVNQDLCISCGKCDQVCPVVAEYKSKNGRRREFYVAYNKDSMIVRKSSSGGIFSALAEFIIKNKKGIVYGVTQTEKIEVKHVRCSTEKEIELLRKSKYLQSDINNTYSYAEKDLKDGKFVLFSGTPCQIAGLYLYLGREYEKLLTVDVSCHGVPSKRVFDMYIDEICNKTKQRVINVEWRDKKWGWYPNRVSVHLDNGEKIISKSMDNSFQKGFLENLYQRPSCYNCKYSKLPRVSDITLADFWGYKGFLRIRNLNRGMSIVVASSVKGIKLFDFIKENLVYKKVDEKIVCKKNRHIHAKPLWNNNRKKIMTEIIKNNKSFQYINQKYINTSLIPVSYYKKQFNIINNKKEKDALIIIGAIGYNRGSEMLLEGTINFCKQANVNQITVSGIESKVEPHIKNMGIIEYIPRYNHLPIIDKIENLFGSNLIITFFKCFNIFKNIWKYRLIIIVGADNFDSFREKPSEYNFIISIIRHLTRKPIILYDCSIQRNNINKYLCKNLSEVDATTARDIISYENLKSVSQMKNIFYFPDPAFCVSSSEIETDYFKNNNQYVTINVSPIVVHNNRQAYSAYIELIKYILKETELNILLIPHVMRNEDLSVLKKIYKEFGENERLNIAEKERLTGNELKYLISKSRFFIGSRTHASIAAYSSIVPTLVLGYSVKSIGIATDLFGDYHNYVIDVRDLKDRKALIQGFIYLQENEEAIRMKLQEKIHLYQRKAAGFTELLLHLINEK